MTRKPTKIPYPEEGVMKNNYIECTVYFWKTI